MGLLEDARNIQRKDPAARNVLEVILLYPGFHILVYHRIAHWLYQHKRFFLARWVSQHGRRRTGIEIHPGATIGKCTLSSSVYAILALARFSFSSSIWLQKSPCI